MNFKKKTLSLLKVKEDQKTTVNGETHDPPGNDTKDLSGLRYGCSTIAHKIPAGCLEFYVKEEEPRITKLVMQTTSDRTVFTA